MEHIKLRNNPLKVKKAAKLMKTVSHPSRLRIIDLLLEKGRMSVKEIYESIGITQSNASQHLKALEDIGILISERDKKNILYRIQMTQIVKLLKCVNECADC